MNYIFKGIVLLYTTTLLINKKHISYEDIVLLLLIFSVSFSIKESQKPLPFLIIESILLVVASFFSNISLCLIMIVLFDCVYYKNYVVTALLLLIITIIPNRFTLNEVSFILMVLSVFCGVYDKKFQQKKALYNQTLDSERRLRYELERAKNELEITNREVERITEVRERNRIAREIHDNAGHNLAAISIQLQAINKLIDNEPEKAKLMLGICTKKVQESLEMIRETVHNIRSVQSVGIANLKLLVDQFKYCETSFICQGDSDKMPAQHYHIFELVLKEALTNISKHSQATLVNVTIEIEQKLSKLTIQDNGKGFNTYSKGIGIKNMRERVLNIGGSFNIESDKGVMIIVKLN